MRPVPFQSRVNKGKVNITLARPFSNAQKMTMSVRTRPSPLLYITRQQQHSLHTLQLPPSILALILYKSLERHLATIHQYHTIADSNTARQQRQSVSIHLSLLNSLRATIIPTMPAKSRKRPAPVSYSSSSVCHVVEEGSSRRRQTSLETFFGKKRVVTPPAWSKTKDCWPMTNNHNHKSKSTIKKKATTKKQMYLDLGQAFSSRHECPHCGTLYVPGLAEDTAAHQRVCRDYRQGVRLPNAVWTAWMQPGGSSTATSNHGVVPVGPRAVVVEVRATHNVTCYVGRASTAVPLTFALTRNKPHSICFTDQTFVVFFFFFSNSIYYHHHRHSRNSFPQSTRGTKDCRARNGICTRGGYCRRESSK